MDVVTTQSAVFAFMSHSDEPWSPSHGRSSQAASTSAPGAPEFTDHCNLNGGTLYCDGQGYACCRTDPNGVEVCVEKDWEDAKLGPPSRSPSGSAPLPPSTQPPRPKSR
jgi:hypothetical protein